MQTLLIQTGETYRTATAAEVAEVSASYALEALNALRPTISKPSDLVTYLQSLYIGRDYETFAVVFLTTRMQVIACVEMFRGTIAGATVHPREVVKEVLWKGAAAVVLAHGHPSGIALPSDADQILTERLQKALALIDVQVLDHLIIGGTGSWYSMREHGLL